MQSMEAIHGSTQNGRRSTLDRHGIGPKNPDDGRPQKGVLKQWILKYRMPPDAVSVSGAEELEKKYGDSIRHLVDANRTGYLLASALKQRSPPLYVTKQSAITWLHKYGTALPVTQINSAGHLEQYVGQRIRETEAAKDLDAEALKSWLYT